MTRVPSRREKLQVPWALGRSAEDMMMFTGTCRPLRGTPLEGVALSCSAFSLHLIKGRAHPFTLAEPAPRRL